MKNHRLTLLTVFLAFTLGACASKRTQVDVGDDGPAETNPLVPTSFGPGFKYNELMIKDYDEMQSMVQSYIDKAEAASNKEGDAGAGEAVEYLGRALKLIFSRPNSDNMVTKLVSEVRRELQGFNAYDDTIAALTNEAIQTESDDNSAVSAQSTSLVILDNILAEIRPEATSENKGLLRVVKHIRDANLKISDEVKRERRMRGMFRTNNPSEDAERILEKMAKAQSKKK